VTLSGRVTPALRSLSCRHSMASSAKPSAPLTVITFYSR